MQKIRVGAVSYLNTKPLLFGIERAESLKDQIKLIVDYPSNIANLLLNNEIDIGLVPVAVIPKMKDYYFVGDYCIGATQAVASVCLFSPVPLPQIQTVLLDYQSNTSINLARVLLHSHWKIRPQILSANKNYIPQIKNTTAGVIIGDRALQQRKSFPYVYDLATGWIEMTGLPFVFAAWISNKKLPDTFVQQFNHANSIGLKNLDKVIAENPFSNYNLNIYYRENLSYEFDEEKRKGLDKFLMYLEEMRTEKV